MKTMTPTLLPVLSSPDHLTPAHMGKQDDAYGRKCVEDARALRKMHEGCVIKVEPKQETVQLMSDVWGECRWLEVTVWNPVDRRGQTLKVEWHELGHGNPHTASIWSPDYTEEAWRSYHQWYTTVCLHEKASAEADAKLRSILDGLNKEMDAVTAVTPVRGRIYKVVRGRKHPKGTIGKLFWSGNNEWGTSYGLAIGDEVDANGKHKSVIFISPSNLEPVLNQTEQDRVKGIQDEMRQAESRWTDEYRTRFMHLLYHWSKEFGYDADVTLRRVTEVMRDRNETNAASILAAAVVNG